MPMSADSGWEYCQLILFDSDVSRESGRWELGIRYMGGGSQMLSKIKGDLGRDWAHNPWEQAIYQLGVGGWELVSVQHANIAGDMGGGGDLSQGQIVAYFKRHIQPGRAISEPALELT